MEHISEVIDRRAMEDDERRIKKVLWQSALLIAISISIPLVAFFWDWRPQYEMINTWLQRSGALVVVLALWVEYKLFSINGDVNPNGIISNEQGELMERFGMWHKIAVFFAAILAIGGTVIWGYGDLLFRPLL